MFTSVFKTILLTYLTRIHHLCTNLDFVNISGTTHHLHTGPDQLYGYGRSDTDRGTGHQSHSAPPAVHRDPTYANLMSRSTTSTLPNTARCAALALLFLSRDCNCHAPSSDPRRRTPIVTKHVLCCFSFLILCKFHLLYCFLF